ncbi:uncharacterized protein FTOL_03037 [Fusarium torulosum]|uniref:Uncharacterized protein n=1 Tax=Fusarium torulosum TaxID=33205 RepID=A0AAE8SFB0_9HYPO|nr:uncharacterized protein FTOL_03037 [Fusarium torulosum]
MPLASGAGRKHSKRAAFFTESPGNIKRRKLELVERLANTNSYEIKNRVQDANNNCLKLGGIVDSAEESRDAIKRSYENAKRALEGARKALGDAEKTLSKAVESRDRAQESLVLAMKMNEACKAIERRNQSERALSKAETSFKKRDDLAISLVDRIELSELDSFFGDEEHLANNQ